ncbi:MAG: hypothetical protein J6Z36_02425, partial [Clostridia bacterium]|nr:hypothetical protein [Clostridia bacterium]
MAVVKMKKFRLIGLSSEKQKIIGALLRSGVVELKPTEEIDLTVRSFDNDGLDEATSVYSRVTVALDYLAKQKDALKKRVKQGDFQKEVLPEEKKALFAVRDEVSADDFENVVLEKEQLLSVCSDLSDIAARQTQVKSDLTALQTLYNGVKEYAAFPMSLNALQSTPHVDFLLGTVKVSEKAREKLFEDIKEFNADAQLITSEEKSAPVILFSAVEKENRQAFEAALSAYAFTPCPYRYECTAQEKLTELNEKISALKEEEKELIVQAVSYTHYTKQLQLLHDNYSFRMDIIRADGDFAKTASAFILESFVPAPDAERVEKAVNGVSDNIVLSVEEVSDEDCPPTLLKNNSVIAPYESITSVYSPPNYRESDPNPAVAFFYFLFFGIMLGDAGYGIILALACFLITKFIKLEKGMKSLLLVFGMGGISGIVWGALFGGYFAVEGAPALLFIPMEEPVNMILLCFALGLLQIFVGMGYQAHELIKDGKLADAIYDIFSWYIIFIGGGLAALPIALGVPMPVFIGVGVLALGIAILMFGGAIRGKGIFGRVIGAVKPLYGIVNYFSDVMSYSRLFGLCLASGVIGLVFNTLGGLIIG